MSWNYRLVVNNDRDDDSFYSIREVYYDKEDNITQWTQGCISPIGENKYDIQRALVNMYKACDKTTLLECTVNGKAILKEL